MLETRSDHNCVSVNIDKTKAVTFYSGGRIAYSDTLRHKGYLLDFVSFFEYSALYYAAKGAT